METNGSPLNGRNPSPDRPGRPGGSPWAGPFYLAAGAACLVLIGMVVARAVRPEAPVDLSGHAFQDPFTRPSGVKPLGREEAIAKSLSLHEARYYRKLDANEVQCELCPTLCRLRDGERGQCKVRVNYAGTLYTLVYGRLVSGRPDPIEKKPLNHFLPGSSIFSVATVGCNLGCDFCQNWQISQAYPEEEPFQVCSPERLVGVTRELQCPSIAYTYTEPSIFYEFMLDSARLARGAGLRTVWVTCGYLNEKPLRELAPFLDGANVDLKGFSEAFYGTYCNAQLAPVLRTIEILKERKVHLEVTNLLIPGRNDDPEMIRAMCRWLATRIGPQVPVHFSRYHPNYKLVRPGPTPPSTLLRAGRIAREEGLKHVYLGNIRLEEGTDTACAGCGKVLIRRRGYWLLGSEVKAGACPACGARIPGLWPGAEEGAVVAVPVDEPLPAKE